MRRKTKLECNSSRQEHEWGERLKTHPEKKSRRQGGFVVFATIFILVTFSLIGYCSWRKVPSTLRQSNDSMYSFWGDDVNNDVNHNLMNNEEEQLQRMILAIVQKWNLTSNKAEELLRQQWHLDPIDKNGYDPDRDFLFFEHIMKTGGTTLSMLLQRLFPDSVFPGSDESAIFHFKQAREALRNSSAGQFYRVGYAHATVRNEVPTMSNPLKSLLLTHLGRNRRIRILSMVREPVALRASLLGMAECQYKAWIKSYNTKHGLDESNCKISLEQMVQRRRDSYVENLCPSMIRFFAKFNITRKVHTPQSRLCEELEQGKDPFTFKLCRSIQALLDSSVYNRTYHNMLKPVMGRYTSQTVRNEGTLVMTTEDVEDYALQDLGGITSSRRLVSKYNSSDETMEPDILWFGITERMEESLCLLFYTLKIPSPDLSRNKNESTNHRVVPCRPTNWWSKEERQEVFRREPWDYAVHRTANAILDLRLRKMRQNILNLQRKDEATTTYFFQNKDQIQLPPFVSQECWELVSHLT